MSDNLYSFQFSEQSKNHPPQSNPLEPPSYEEATGTNSEIPTTVEFPEPRLIFPESDFSFQPPKLHTINLKDIPVETSSSGITSHEALLNKDPTLLHQFFLYHNTAPELFVDIEGYHYDSVEESHQVTREDGGTEWTTSSTEERVTDFQMSYDTSLYVIPSGILHLANPEAHDHSEDSSINSLSQLFINYTHSDNQLKEICLEKIIQWDFEELTRAISYSIRTKGYRGKIQISYRRKNYKVKVLSESKWSKLYHSKVMSVLCVLTCCFIIWWPAGYYYKDRLGENFRSSFKMSISTQEWYYKNISSILSQVRNL